MKMLLFPHFLAQRRSREKTEKYKTQNSTCGVLRKDTLYALSFSVLHTKTIDQPVGREKLTRFPTLIQLLPSHGGPEVLLEGWVGLVALPDFGLLIQPRLT